MATAFVTTVIQNVGGLGYRAGHTKHSKTDRLWSGEEVERTFQAEAQDMRGPLGAKDNVHWRNVRKENMAVAGEAGAESTRDPSALFCSL